MTHETGETPAVTVHRLDAGRVEDFRSLLLRDGSEGKCQCVAWWVPTWEGWEDRTKEENAALRNALFARGEYDGYLLYAGAQAVGWCQVGSAGRLEKLCSIFGLDREDPAWAITCFLIDPVHRGSGLAHALLTGVLEDLRARGIRRVLAFPRVEPDLPADDVWTGPQRLFVAAGFRPVRGGGRRSVWEWTAES